MRHVMPPPSMRDVARSGTVAAQSVRVAAVMAPPSARITTVRGGAVGRRETGDGVVLTLSTLGEWETIVIRPGA